MSWPIARHKNSYSNILRSKPKCYQSSIDQGIMLIFLKKMIVLNRIPKHFQYHRNRKSTKRILRTTIVMNTKWLEVFLHVYINVIRHLKTEYWHFYHVYSYKLLFALQNISFANRAMCTKTASQSGVYLKLLFMVVAIYKV